MSENDKKKKHLEIDEFRLSDGTVLKDEDLADLNAKDITRLRKSPEGDNKKKNPRKCASQKPQRFRELTEAGMCEGVNEAIILKAE